MTSSGAKVEVTNRLTGISRTENAGSLNAERSVIYLNDMIISSVKKHFETLAICQSLLQYKASLVIGFVQ